MSIENPNHSKHEEEPETSNRNFSSKEKLDKQFGSLHKSALAVVFATAILGKVEKLHSTEVEPTMNWESGIETLRDEIYKAQTETMAMYVEHKDGKYEWVIPRLDKKMPSSGSVLIDSAMESIEDDLKEGEIGSVCHIHTHPLSVAEHTKTITKEEQSHDIVVSLPPSNLDISYLNNITMEDYYDKFPANKDISITQAVVDARGVWYYDELTAAYAKRFSRDFIPELIDAGDMRNNLLDRTFTKLAGMQNATLDEIIKTSDFLQNKGKLYPLSEPHKRLLISTALLERGDWGIANSLLESEPLVFSNFLSYRKKVLIRFNDAQKVYTEASKKEGEIPTAIREELYKAYALKEKSLRFVPYSELEEEPSCAGVNYKKE